MTKEEITNEILTIIEKENISLLELSKILGINHRSVINSKSTKKFTKNNIKKLQNHVDNFLSTNEKLDVIIQQNNQILENQVK